jgi:hypothetical protein
MQRRDLLEVAERDMRGVEIDRGDPGRIGDEIGKGVAAARGDGDDMAIGGDRQRLHVHLGVFPDLGIDQAAKGEGEHALEQALRAEMLVAVDRAAHGDVLGGLGDTSHGRTPVGAPADARSEPHAP